MPEFHVIDVDHGNVNIKLNPTALLNQHGEQYLGEFLSRTEYERVKNAFEPCEGPLYLKRSHGHMFLAVKGKYWYIDTKYLVLIEGKHQNGKGNE